MSEIVYPIAAPVAAAVLMFVAPTLSTTPQVRYEVPRRVTWDGPIDLRDLFIVGTGGIGAVHDPIEGVDFGELTESDVAMMQHALTAGAAEIDFSEFYLDDED